MSIDAGSDDLSSVTLSDNSSYFQSWGSSSSVDTDVADGSSSVQDSESGSEEEDSESEWSDGCHGGYELPNSVSVKLYDGCDITVLESHMLMFQYCVRHALTAKAFGELLQLVAVHLPQTAKVCKTAYRMKSFFLSIFPDETVRRYLYCSCCHRLLDGDVHNCARLECNASSVESFVAVPLQAQLKRIMKDPDSWKAISKRLNGDNASGDLKDICDGEEYQKYHVFLSNPCNISLLCNTDGVAIYKSSKVSIWPVWLVINELPREKRFQKKNMLLYAIWYSAEKPSMTTFLKPLVDDINDLYLKGVEVCTPEGNKLVRAILLQCSVDLPAKAMVLEMKQFNGKYGCSYCEDEGQQREGAPQLRYWPYRPPLGRPPLRTHLSIIECAKEALTTKNAIMGVKGPCAFFQHPPFNMARGTVIDVLHCLYLGVVPLLLSRWFDKEYKGKEHYIGDKIELCDERLLKIRVPDVITRVPKTLHDFKHWKGSQSQWWLLLFSLPVLRGLLPTVYLSHLCLLICAVHILSSDCVTPMDLVQASDMLESFYGQMADHYGRLSCTMNVHLLSHLSQCVTYWGPLWAYSCFSFESMNGQLKQYFHGTRDMSTQAAFSYVMMQSIPRLHHIFRLNRVQTVANVLFGRKGFKKQEIDGTDFSVVGGLSPLLPSPLVLEEINKYLATVGGNPLPARARVQAFFRLIHLSSLYYSAKYARVKKRNSFTVAFQPIYGHLYFGLIQYFLMIQSQPLAVIRQLLPCGLMHEVCEIDILAVDKLILPVVVTNDYHVVNVNCIVKKCVYVQISVNKSFIAMFPSSVFVD